MRKLLILAALGLIVLTLGAAWKPSHERTFEAWLSGENEVPPRETDAWGKADFEFSRDGSELRYKLVVGNIQNVVAAHIHLGASDVNGPVVAFLYMGTEPRDVPFVTILAQGVITEDDLVGPLEGYSLDRLFKEMKYANTYVNVHTNDGEGDPNTGPGDFPGGEIRGQIYWGGARG